MCEKYPLTLLDSTDIMHTRESKDAINLFHNFKDETPATILTTYPSLLTCCVLPDQLEYDPSVCKRLLCVLLAALRTNGSSGVHCVMNSTDTNMQQFYAKLGFTEILRENEKIYLGRKF
jgi:hypothetical protein